MRVMGEPLAPSSPFADYGSPFPTSEPGVAGEWAGGSETSIHKNLYFRNITQFWCVWVRIKKGGQRYERTTATLLTTTPAHFGGFFYKRLWFRLKNFVGLTRGLAAPLVGHPRSQPGSCRQCEQPRRRDSHASEGRSRILGDRV